MQHRPGKTGEPFQTSLVAGPACSSAREGHRGRGLIGEAGARKVVSGARQECARQQRAVLGTRHCSGKGGEQGEHSWLGLARDFQVSTPDLGRRTAGSGSRRRTGRTPWQEDHRPCDVDGAAASMSSARGSALAPRDSGNQSKPQRGHWGPTSKRNQQKAKGPHAAESRARARP